MTFINPRYIVLNTIFSSSPKLKELQGDVDQINNKFKRKNIVKLAFVSFRSNRDQEKEDAINNIIDVKIKHEPLKKLLMN